MGRGPADPAAYVRASVHRRGDLEAEISRLVGAIVAASSLAVLVIAVFGSPVDRRWASYGTAELPFDPRMTVVTLLALAPIVSMIAFEDWPLCSAAPRMVAFRSRADRRLALERMGRRSAHRRHGRPYLPPPCGGQIVPGRGRRLPIRRRHDRCEALVRSQRPAAIAALLGISVDVFDASRQAPTTDMLMRAAQTSRLASAAPSGSCDSLVRMRAVSTLVARWVVPLRRSVPIASIWRRRRAMALAPRPSRRRQRASPGGDDLQPGLRRRRRRAAGSTESVTGPHPVVVLDANGGEHVWTDDVPTDWIPDSVETTELVVCVGAETMEARPACPEAPDVERSAEVVPVRVMAAATGVEVDRFELTGGRPTDAPGGEASANGIVGIGDFMAALAAYVYPGSALRPGETPATPEPTPRTIELTAAIEEGAITIKVRGDGLQAIDLTITPSIEDDMEIVVEPGTRFAPGAAGTQVMVVSEEARIEVRGGFEVDWELDVACGEMNDATPTADDGFTLVLEEPPQDLVNLLNAAAFLEESFRVQQFAIWTITDNPAPGAFMGLSSPSASGGPSAGEITRIKVLFDAAGIPLGSYRATK
jgi:hypothetical protein